MEDRHLSLSEVAEIMEVTERTVRRWIKAGRLKAYKPGRDYRIPESAVKDFIERSEAYPKAKAPPPLDSGDERGKQALREIAPEVWVAWGQELDGWTDLINTMLLAEYAPRVESLPEDPDADQRTAELPWINKLLDKVASIERLLHGFGVENGIVPSFLIYQHRGHHIPEEAQAAFERYFAASRAALFGAQRLRRRAVAWAYRGEEVKVFRANADTYNWAAEETYAHRRPNIDTQ